jgi:hypothetical protein
MYTTNQAAMLAALAFAAGSLAKQPSGLHKCTVLR